MSESMSSPWIRDYLLDVAETYGAQLYNAPVVSSRGKKVQLTDFLTYQENSYVWAWISDKNYRISVRISRDAAGAYKTQHSRNIIDCRFFLVGISSYRPMFSPRPLGPNTTGNTPVSHLSLEVDQVRLVGVGGHLFGNPRDLELDDKLKEWALGLRQDGGGGNVLKLRKQQELVCGKKTPQSPPHPAPLPLYPPLSQCQVTKAIEVTAKAKPEQPQDLKRAYAKRWRIVETNPWKFATKSKTKECPNLYPTPHRTSSPTFKPQQQGTPTEWSPSNRGSPITIDRAASTTFSNQVRRHNEPEVLPTTPRIPSDTEGHTTTGTIIISDTRSLQPPTPAQRIQHLPLPASTSARNSPESAPSSLPSQQFPCSSPPPPGSPLPLPSSSLPIPTSLRKTIQRKVPHPGLPSALPDPTNQRPAHILVPNSDTSGTGSSQSCSQSQHPSQSQRSRFQLLTHPSTLPSSLAKDFEPLDASTPREAKPSSSTRRTSKMFAESLPIHCDLDEQKTTSKDVRHSTEKSESNIRRQEGPDSARLPGPSAPKIEVLEVGTSDTEEETEQLQLTHSIARPEVGFDMQNGTQDTDKGDAGADHKDDHFSINKVEVHPVPQRNLLRWPISSVIQQSFSNEQDAAVVSHQHSLQSPECSESQAYMHSLFSDSLKTELAVSSHVPSQPVNREDEVRGKTSAVQMPGHDPGAWKEPSFLARDKRKGKAHTVEGPEPPSGNVDKKRQQSVQPESLVSKRSRVAVSEVPRMASGQAIAEIVQRQDTESSTSGKIYSSDRPSISQTNTTETVTPSTALQSSKPRLANFVVDFERRVLMPIVDLEKDIKSIMLRTGRIRTLGEKVERDGSAYIMR